MSQKNEETQAYIAGAYDVIVIGAGHAGCEAALAAARLGQKTLMLTMNLDSIANMPCNPNIGGTAKGQLVREVDAMGGQMGITADETMIQMRILNKAKGPAVYSQRAQIDRRAYQNAMKLVLEKQENLDLRQAEVTELILSKDAENNPCSSNPGLPIEQSISLTAIPQVEQTFPLITNPQAEQTFPLITNPKAEQTLMGVTNPQTDQTLPLITNPKAEQTLTGATNPQTDQLLHMVRIRTGTLFQGKAIILTTGTFLRGKIIIGDMSHSGGPDGMHAADLLSESLKNAGIRLMRFKTGTPARINARSIDFSKMEIQPGDDEIVPFSFLHEPFPLEQLPCWLTHTGTATHDTIRANLHRSPLFSGAIEGVGPRYCPSIEDKVVRFADRDSHQIFVEPIGRDTLEMYLQGLSSSLPEDVQEEVIRSLPGLEHASVMRSAYAIEYDCVDPLQLRHTLEFRDIPGLYSAGQSNGSSGYEEAAAQGLVAGVNASLKNLGRAPMEIDRSEAYIGVLVDDLVTKGTNEPYRMMTSRAEYRLYLRQDNADLRLTEKGRTVGLVSEERYARFQLKKERIEKETTRLRTTVIPPSQKLQDFLVGEGSSPVQSGIRLSDLLKRPEIGYEAMAAIDENRPDLPKEVWEQVSIYFQYEGYLSRQMQQIEQFRKTEGRKLSEDIDYRTIGGLSLEARQKLFAHKPESLGQASRISGVSPSDIAVLQIWLEAQSRKKKSEQ